LLNVHLLYRNAPFRLPFTHALISTSHARSINQRGALYALTNCPCSIFCHRGLIQPIFVGNGVCDIPDCIFTGLLVVHRVSIGFVVSFIFPWVVNSAHTFAAVVGCIYVLITF
jgi:hypothetical protein